VNPVHLKTIAWLRWRLMVNQLARISKGQRIFSLVIIALAGIGSLVLFGLTWWGSGNILRQLPRASLVLLLWAGLGAGFLFGWSIGVLTDLQRSEPLSLQKFLHLPVSPRGAFAMNFLSSFISFSLVLMFPILLGFSFGMVNHFGPRLLPGILLLGAFVLLAGALTWQFRGWLASLMISKRRRRTIITVFTLSIVLIAQIPNILNLTVFRDAEKIAAQREQAVQQERAELRARLDNQQISQQQFQQEMLKISKQIKARKLQRLDAVADLVRPACVWIPFGWLAVGMESLARGNSLVHLVLIPAACLSGLLGLACLSLWKSYRSTLRLYRGEAEDPATPQPAIDSTPIAVSSTGRLSGLMQRIFPLLNEHQSAVAAGTMVGVMRAPEAKLALLTPFLIMVLLGISFAWREGSSLPAEFRPFTAIGVATFAMFGIMQLINNQFGYDRSGFRCLVLSPIQRGDILIGKNMAFAPFAIGIGALGIVALQCFLPMKAQHLLASFVQLATIYLITCLVANFMSIRAPLAIAAGTMKPMNINVGVVVLQLLITMLLPLGLLPTMIPPGVDWLLVSIFGWQAVPVYLLLSLCLLALTVVVYRIVIRAQGRMLREHETRILEIVTQPGT
jgi:hypothetical protein